MFQARRERFPRHIHFTTQRNRFLESFWVRLHGIAPGYQTATVEATLTSSTSIELKIVGVRGNHHPAARYKPKKLRYSH